MWNRISAWLSLVIGFIAVIIDYFALPSMMGIFNQGGWAILAMIVIVPFLFIFAIAGVVLVFISAIKGFITGKWYLIVLNILLIGFAVIVGLTCFGIMPSIIA